MFNNYEKEVISLLTQKVKEKHIALRIFKDVKYLEFKEASDFLNKGKNAKKNSYIRHNCLLNTINKILENNLDLKYPELRLLVRNKMSLLTERKFETFEEVLELEKKVKTLKDEYQTSLNILIDFLNDSNSSNSN